MTALVASAVLLSGCLVQSKVQGRYVEDQGECRGSAEGNIGRYETEGMSTKDRNAQLVTLFSDCMAKQGWQVARPKRKPTTDGPHGPLDPYGRAATTVTTSTTTTQGPDSERVMQSTTTTNSSTQHQRAVQQYHQGRQAPATQAPVGQRPVETQPQLLSPSPGMAPLSAPESTGPARYQPGRSYVPAAPYGSGAGRNF